MCSETSSTFIPEVTLGAMDAEARDRFRWKFYRLAVELNIIILLVAVSVLFLFILPSRLESYRLSLIVIMLLAAALISIDFRKR